MTDDEILALIARTDEGVGEREHIAELARIVRSLLAVAGDATSIQGTPVDPSTPHAAQSFIFDGTDWVPMLDPTGVPAGGTTGQVLAKNTDTSYDTAWVAGGGGGSGISSPLDIPGCVLWLDASDATTINAGSPSDGEPVSAWSDKSTSGYDAAQATANNQPVYKTNIENGLSVVRFDPSSDPQFVELTGTALGILRGAEGATIVIAATHEHTDGSGGMHTSTAAWIGTNGDATVGRLGISGAGFYAAADSGAPIVPNLEYANTTGLLVVIGTADFRHSLAYTGSAPDLAESFTAAGLASGTSSSPFEDANASIFQIGNDGTDAAPFDGDIGELAIFSRGLNALERREIVEYLSVKWATP